MNGRSARRLVDAILGRRFTTFVIGVCALALLVRLGVIAASQGGADLRIYHYFSGLVLGGHNPFLAQPGAPIPIRHSNNQAFELLVFAGLLKISDHATTLRVFFALCDVATIALIAFAFPRPRAWRAAFIAFYAINPFVLVSWTGTAEDKTVALLLIVVVVLAIERARAVLAFGASAVLTAFKFLGATFFPILALHHWPGRGRRAILLLLVGAALVFAVSNLPFFPDSLRAYSRRQSHLSITPGQAAWTQLLDAIGLYRPIVARVLTVVAGPLVWVLYLRRRLDAVEAIAWCVFGAHFALPDHSYAHVLLIALPFLLFLELSRRSWLWLWIVTTVSAVMVELAVHPPSPGGALHDVARAVAGPYGSIRHVLWANLPLVLVLVSYARARRRASLPREPLLWRADGYEGRTAAPAAA